MPGPQGESIHALHVYSGNLFGGIERLLITIATTEADRPARHSVALTFDGPLRTELLQAGVPVFRLGAVRTSRPWSVLRARRALANLIAVEHPDVVVCHAPWSLAVFGPAVRKAGIPLVFAAHEARFGAHWIDRWARRTSPDFIIANSQFTALGLTRSFPTVPAVVVYPPIAPSDSVLSEPVRRDLRRSLDTAEQATVIMHAGRLESFKGHALLIQALARLSPEFDWVLWQTGGVQRPHEMKYLDSLRTIAANLGVAHRIRFIGQRSDVRRLLEASDIYCQPNTSPEGFGLVFMEALYAGVPVVTTQLGPASELIDDSCGVLIPANDVDALARALGALVESRARRTALGASGRERARQMCEPGQQATALLRALHASIRQCARGPAPSTRASSALETWL